MNKNLIATFCAALLLTACGEADHPHAKDGSHPAAAEAAHAHGAGGEKITHFTDKTELFVEFPRLVAGEKSAFAAHLTRLADFQALAVGKVSVILSGGGQPDDGRGLLFHGVGPDIQPQPVQVLVITLQGGL